MNLKSERMSTNSNSIKIWIFAVYIDTKDLKGLKNILVGAWSDNGQLLQIKFKLTAGSVGLLGYRFLDGYIWIAFEYWLVSVM